MSSAPAGDMSNDWRVVSAGSCFRERWKNGLGWTTEVDRLPKRGAWSWRLSIAESDQPADFSSYPGVDRELVLLAGAGLRLRFHDGATHELSSPYESFRFAGDRPVTGEPIGGLTRQFNLMWRRDRLLGQVSFRQLTQPFELDRAAGTERAVHLISGNAELRRAGNSQTLAPGDTAFVVGGREPVWIQGSGALLEVILRQPSQFEPR